MAACVQSERYSSRHMLLGIFYLEYNKKVKHKMTRQRHKRTPDLPAIGARIRALRRDMLQEDLAVQLGVSQGQLSKIERGKMAPTIEFLLGLSQMYGRSIDWIVTGEDSD